MREVECGGWVEPSPMHWPVESQTTVIEAQMENARRAIEQENPGLEWIDEPILIIDFAVNTTACTPVVAWRGKYRLHATR